MKRAIAMALLLVAASAAADPPADDLAAAEALFDAGKKLEAAGNYAEACAKFEASQRLDAGLGTMLYLADCYEKIGRAASAWAKFREAAALAKAAGQADRERTARTRATALEGKLFKLTLAVEEPDRGGLEIRRGGTIVKKEVFGVPVPIDPGKYAITVTAPGTKSWSISIEIPTAAGDRTVKIPPLEPDTPATQTAAPSASAAPTSAAPTVSTTPSATPSAEPPVVKDKASDGSTQRIVGIGMGGLGAVGVGVGVALSIVAINKNKEAASLCNDGTRCKSQSGETASSTARSEADGATIAFIAGGALLAAGATVFLTAPSSKSKTAVSFSVGPRAGALSLTKEFQ